MKRYFHGSSGGELRPLGRAVRKDLFDAQLDVRELLRAQVKLNGVIISTGMFTSFLFEAGL
jgi:hypothetical protein